MSGENRYERLFTKLKERGEGAFVPFVMLGDPDAETSLEIIKTLAANGADALELGIAFSDPVADGPVIQAAAARALTAGATPENAFAIISAARQAFADIPIGLLVYANLVVNKGPADFYAKAKAAGVDSILVADAPTAESGEFCRAARAHEIDQIFIVPPNADEEKLREIASAGSGYTYYLGRAGVTGADREMTSPHTAQIEFLKEAGAPPIVVGFGISSPHHVTAALEAGAAGAISGSAIVKIVESNLADKKSMHRELARFSNEMKCATKKQCS